jgi:hypothetical protein
MKSKYRKPRSTLQLRPRSEKRSYKKLMFCAQRAKRDGLRYIGYGHEEKIRGICMARSLHEELLIHSRMEPSGVAQPYIGKVLF